MLPHAGRSETEIEYSVGFDADGIISALDCKTWCLAGAFLDLAWNDLYGVMTGLDQVSLLNMLFHKNGWVYAFLPAFLCSRLGPSMLLVFVLLLPEQRMQCAYKTVCIEVHGSVFLQSSVSIGGGCKSTSSCWALAHTEIRALC